jgi:hypothetical protein
VSVITLRVYLYPADDWIEVKSPHFTLTSSALLDLIAKTKGTP